MIGWREEGGEDKGIKVEQMLGHGSFPLRSLSTARAQCVRETETIT